MANKEVRRGMRLALTVAAIALAGSACGGPSNTPTSGTTGAETTGGQAPGTQVTAKLTDFHIDLSQHDFTVGTYTFVASNQGQTVHALKIAGPGVPGQQTGTLEKGQSAKLTVNLQTGSYELYCPVDGHKDQGMDLTITVGSGAGPATTAPASPASSGSGY